MRIAGICWLRMESLVDLLRGQTWQTTRRLAKAVAGTVPPPVETPYPRPNQIRMRLFGLLMLALLPWLFASCCCQTDYHPAPQPFRSPAAGLRAFSVKGVVKEVNPNRSAAAIQHEAISNPTNWARRSALASSGARRWQSPSSLPAAPSLTSVRLSKNFEEASQKLAALPEAPTNWHFLSVSFDTDCDTPAVLKAYAGRSNYDPAHWSFLTESKDKVNELARRSQVTVEPDAAFFNHSFRTLIIDAQAACK